MTQPIVRTDYTTPTCPGCGHASTITVDAAALRSWQDGALIQNAFPDLSIGKREQIKTGWHPRCWSSWFDDMEDPDAS